MTMTLTAPVLASEVGTKYFEVGYAQISYKESGISTYSIPAVKGTFGYVVSNGIALEGYLATGVGDDTQTYRIVPIKLSIDSMYGTYVRPFLKISESAEIYGRLGFSEVKLTGSNGNVRINATGNDFSYGVGAAYSVSKTTQMVFDYMMYYSKGDIKITGSMQV